MDILTSIATFIFLASLKGTVVIAMVLMAQKALSRYLSASGRYRLWIAVVLSLVTPVGFELRVPQLPAMHAFMQAAVVHAQPALDDASITPAGTPPDDMAPPVGETTSNRESTLAVLWLAGVLAVLAAMIGSSRRVRALARNASAAPESLQALLRECARQAGCATPIRLLASPDLRTPLIAGAFKPVLLWPAGLDTQLTPMQLQHVLMHEVMHVKRRDIFSACIVAVLQAVHWFNPAIWIAFAWLREDREMACDADTVRIVLTDHERGSSHDSSRGSLHDHAHDYARTLIQLGAMQPAAAQLPPGLGILDSPAQLRRRIHMLAQTADPTARHFLSGALLLAFSALAFSQPRPTPRAAEAPAPVPVVEAAMPSRAPIAAQHDAIAEAVAAISGDVAEPPTAMLETIAESEAPPVQIIVAAVSEPAAMRVAPEPLPVPVAPQVTIHEAPDRAVIAPQVSALANQGDELICRRETTPGSRVRTRVCLTEEEWDAGNMVPKSAFTRRLSPTDFLEPLPLSAF